MKKSSAFILLLLTAGGAVGQPGFSNSSRQAKQVAIDLFATTGSSAAVAHLKSAVPPESGTDGNVTALVQSLVEIASTLFNQRQTNLAREVSVQAFAIAEPIIQGRSSAPANRRSDLLGSLGTLSEHVLVDLKTAELLYGAAATLNPANQLNAQRKNAVVEKQKSRLGAPGS